MQKKALIVQDISCFGKCSTGVALPVVSSFNVECALLPTALLSAHTGFPKYTCFDLTREMRCVLADWEALSLCFDGFYSGYMLSDEQACLALEAIDRLVKKGAVILVDPVMGDDGKAYAMLNDSFGKRMRELVARADVITPNLTEAALLLEREPVLHGYGQAYIEKSLFALRELGCKTPMITGVSFDEKKIGVAFLEGNEVSYVFSKKYDGVACGTGDTFSSVLFGALLSGLDMKRAAEKAVLSTERAIQSGVKEYGINFETLLA